MGAEKHLGILRLLIRDEKHALNHLAMKPKLASLALVWNDCNLGRQSCCSCTLACIAAALGFRHIPFLYYLGKCLSKPHHKFSFASLFVFSFLTLDKTC